ncbi:MAG: hypothetical protein DMF63_03215 [Acidobacteria bacterium]|nr:MAG: hypothetical protein DMF63_03215 [Acidobacteriota bacterium]
MSLFVDFITRNVAKPWFGFATALAASVLTIAIPIYVHGFRETMDMRSHLSFAHAFQSAFRAGEVYPGWSNDNLGFGSVGARFYPPLPAFLSAVFELGTGDWHLAYSLNLFLWMLAGGFGMFLFIREWGPPFAGIFAAVLYTVVPYHIAEIYRFFLYAEFAGMAVLPFCFLYLTRLCRRGNWKDVIPLAISSSILVLTHIPITLMMALTALVYVPLVIDRSRWKKISLRLATAAAIVVAATAFFWLPVATEVLWVAHSNPQFTVAGYEHGPMLFPYMLVDYDTTYMLSYLRHFDIVTVLTMGLLIPAIALLIIGRRDPQGSSRQVMAAATLSAGLGIFLFSKPSAFLWTNVELLQRLQYPWRWLSIVSVLSVASIALALASLVEQKRVMLRRGVYCAVLLLVGFASVDIRQIRSTPFAISADRFNQLAKEVESEKVADHWWPVWAKAAAFDNSELVTAAGREVQLESWEKDRRVFRVGEGEPVTVRIATFYYPHWQAKVNGSPVEVGKADDGTITIPVGKESSKIEIRFEEPARNRVSAVVSLIVSILMGAALLFSFLRKPASK